MRHEAHGQAATPHRASPGRRRCGTRPSKKDSTRMQQGCTLNTRMGLGPARCFTADIAQPNPGSPRRGDCSPTYPRVQRRSACIPVKPCLLRHDPHAAATGPRTLRAGQNPMHQFRPPCRRDRGAGRTPCTCTDHRQRIAPAATLLSRAEPAAQNPMHQFRTVRRGRRLGWRVARRRQDPMHQKQLPERCCPPSRPGAHVRRWRDSSGIGRAVI
jgi:hypothetical protein